MTTQLQLEWMWCQELSEPGNSDRFCMEHGVTYEILITNYAMQKLMWLALALMAEGLWKKRTNVLWYKHTLCWAHFTMLMVGFKRSTHLREVDKNSHIEAIKCTLGINYGRNFIANALTPSPVHLEKLSNLQNYGLCFLKITWSCSSQSFVWLCIRKMKWPVIDSVTRE